MVKVGTIEIEKDRKSNTVTMRFEDCVGKRWTVFVSPDIANVQLIGSVESKIKVYGDGKPSTETYSVGLYGD